tara:strand:+ start:63934 stop:64518 length:585 start_codon:yes stop_codon:yes gene_type:complete
MNLTEERDRTINQFTKSQFDYKIRLDNELYRHITVRGPDSMNQWHDIVSWPDHLCICGDMGTFTFSRCEDMFPFFNHDKVNIYYWAEKICFTGQCTSPIWTEYDSNLFKEELVEYKEELLKENNDEHLDKLEEIQDQLDGGLDDTSEEGAYEFMYRINEHYEHCGIGFKKPTYNFVWCCEAIRTAVKNYYLTKQ